MSRKLNKKQVNMIMKAALVALIESSPERRKAYGLPRNLHTEDIREVYQCLPDFDHEYNKARDFLTRAFKVIKEVQKGGSTRLS